MRVAIIDIGTNTFHLLIADLTDESHKVVTKKRNLVKLGEKGINKGEITEEAKERAISALLDFKKFIGEYNVGSTHAIATSAVRNATNQIEFINEVYDKTGIEIEVITGTREAELILNGVTQAIEFKNISLIVDIGGGSVEFILVNPSNETLWLKSFEIGGQRLVEKFHKTDPISQNNIADLEKYLADELSELFEVCAIYNPSTMVGCSGTFESLNKIHLAEIEDKFDVNYQREPAFSLTNFNQINNSIISKDRADRLKINGMSPMRVDLIVVCSILIDFVLKNTKIKTIEVSPYALKEGLLKNVIEHQKT